MAIKKTDEILATGRRKCAVARVRMTEGTGKLIVNGMAAEEYFASDALCGYIAQVFKTLVLQGDKTGHIVCVVPGDMEVDLKALAKASGNKKVEMIAMKDLLAVTGYIRGGCSPVGMKKRFPTYFHSTALNFEHIYVSAGVRGLQIEISPSALIDFVGAKVADVAC
jgi:Cys-tRNA(Pro)/Cys-tRNA(Cys) deacylase